MRRSIRVIAAMLIALGLLALPTVAAADPPYQERGVIIDDPPQHPNICGWMATFEGTGKYWLIVEETAAGPIHVTYHETFNYSLVLDDDPSVPVSLRGVTWRGQNVETVIFNADADGQLELFVSRQHFAEGPFRGLLEQITFVRDANGIIRVDRQVLFEGVDCSALTS